MLPALEILRSAATTAAIVRRHQKRSPASSSSSTARPQGRSLRCTATLTPRIAWAFDVAVRQQDCLRARLFVVRPLKKLLAAERLRRRGNRPGSYPLPASHRPADVERQREVSPEREPGTWLAGRHQQQRGRRNPVAKRCRPSSRENIQSGHRDCDQQTLPEEVNTRFTNSDSTPCETTSSVTRAAKM